MPAPRLGFAAAARRFAAVHLALIAASSAGALVGCASSATRPVAGPALPSATRAIEELCAGAELRRVPDAAVRRLLTEGAGPARARAALAAGRIADAESVPALEKLLADPQAGEEAAWALGRIEGGEGPLLRCLGSDACPAQAAAARALAGRRRRPAVAAGLLSALPGAEKVAAEAGLALSILARTDAAGSFAADPDPAGASQPGRERAAPGSAGQGGPGPAGAAQVTFAQARDAAVVALSRPEPSVRLGAAAMLARLPAAPERQRAPGTPLHRALAAALADLDPLVRAHAARAFGKQMLPALELASVLQDADWRVRVEAATALGSGAAEPVGVLLAAVPQAVAELDRPGVASARWAHPLVALLDAAGKLGRAAAGAVPDPSRLNAATPAATAAVRCAAAQARDRIAGKIEATVRCGAGLEPEWRSRLRSAALAAELASAGPPATPGAAAGAAPAAPPVQSSPSPDLLARALAGLTDSEPRIRAAAAGRAGAVLADPLRKLLADADPFVVAAAAGALAQSQPLAAASVPEALDALNRLSAARSRPAGDPASDALAALLQLVAASAPPQGASSQSAAPRAGGRDVASALRAVAPVASPYAYRALVDALHAYGAPPPSGTPPAPPVPPEALAGKPGGVRARVLRLRTSAGDLVIDLHSADGQAPLTASAVAALARRGFYDGLTFHRVVPDFVVQGGDPRGDGDGGPGWSVPDEHGPQRFLRGTVGIATNGPETGGSQLFLCHSPQPHLDGRYTIVGELRDGADVLDSLQVGDVILAASVE